jgi:phosphoribosylamine---glycine ligase
VLYAGLMLTKKGIRVLEFNTRFGDPECQAILMRWDGDILPALIATAEGRLDASMVKWKANPSVCVVVAAANYPGTPKTGDEITGLEQVNDAVVFHAGTKMAGGRVVTAGGRVLGVTSDGSDLSDALRKAYSAIDRIHFEGMQFRRDIGWRAKKNF